MNNGKIGWPGASILIALFACIAIANVNFTIKEVTKEIHYKCK